MMASAPRTMDIEKLLQWAFRDELPKRSMPALGPGYISPLARLVDMGTLIDETAGEPGFPAALGEPDPDALVVEAIVSSLADCEIDWPATRREVVGPVGGLLDDRDPTLASLTIGTVGLVAIHARMGTRPRWDLWPAPEPVIGRNGKPIVQFLAEDGTLAEGRRARHYGPGARCPIDWFPTPREVAFARVEYSIWWQALDTLADALEGQLRSVVALPPGAHPSPWVSGNLTIRTAAA